MYLYNNEMYCECEDRVMESMPETPQLARAYVPFQHAKCLYAAEKGLCHGSMFPELVQPYRSPFHCEKEEKK